MLRHSLAILLVSFALGTTANAENTSGTDVIRAKDMTARTLLIGETTYQVGPRTAISDAKGAALTLETLDVMGIDDMNGLVPLGSSPRARFEARPTPDGLLLIQVDLLETRD